jgi:2-octaprenylphenol hydroxylase
LKRDFDVVVLGGAMAGAAAAALLAADPKTGALRIALVEPCPATAPTVAEPFELRVSALSRTSQRLLERTGAWSAVQARGAAAYERMVVWDQRSDPGGPAALRFDAAELGEPDLGHIVENRAVQAALLECAQQAGVVLLQTDFARLEAGDAAVTIALADGRSYRAALAVGADGSDSMVRTQAGIGVRGWGYDQRAVVTHLRPAKPHAATAWQRFLDTGPLALLPLADGRVSLVWTTTPALAQELTGCTDEEFSTRVTEASAGILGRLDCTAPRASFPLRLLHADQYAAHRIALVGDAAHTVHPLAGQGINLAFLDVAALVDVTGDAVQAGDDPGERRALRRYERWRKAEALPAIALLDGIQKLFQGDGELRSRLRRSGLELVQAARPLKRIFMQRALGISGELPASLRKGDATLY